MHSLSQIKIENNLLVLHMKNVCYVIEEIQCVLSSIIKDKANAIQEKEEGRREDEKIRRASLL